MSYFVIFKNDFTKRCRILSGPYNTLQEAAQNRFVSGDLVVDSKMNTVPDTTWLWPWEAQNPESYAHRQVLLAQAVR